MVLAKINKYSKQTFSSLSIRNYRLFFIGQAISGSGSFMQSIAQVWLILTLTHSGTALGIILALQYLPILLLSPFAGGIVDRYSKRNLLYVTQSCFALLTISLGLLVLTNHVQIWMVYVFALCYGLINTLDYPLRQTLVAELVGKESLRNAIALTSTLTNITRIIGPAIAGVVIATAGLALCFILNGVSYFALILMLLIMRSAEFKVVPKAKKAPVSEGFRYAKANPIIFSTLIMMCFIGILTWEFSVSLPLLAERVFNGDAKTFAALTTAMGIGAVIAGLITASWQSKSRYELVIAALLFGIATIVLSVMPTFGYALIAMLFVGAAAMYFSSLGNNLLQSESSPEMRGRMISFWSMLFLGGTTIGAPIIGYICEQAGVRWGLAVGGVAALIGALFGYIILDRIDNKKK